MQKVIKDKYPFLNIYSEKDAILLGITPPNKQQQELYKYIQKQSNLPNARKGELFHFSQNHMDVAGLKHDDLVIHLNRLVSDKLVLHFVCLKHELSNHRLYAMSYFSTHPTDKFETIEDIFQEMVQSSEQSVKNWYENKDSSHPNKIRKELLTYLSVGNPDEISNLNPNSIINFSNFLRAFKYDIITSKELLDATAKELSDSLIADKMAIELDGKGLMLIKEEDILLYFETTIDILKQKVIPQFKSDTKLKQKIEQVELDEMRYNFHENSSAKTAKFASKIAQVIKTSKQSLPFYPGSVIIEVILNLESIAEKKYIEVWREDCQKVKFDFKRSLTDTNSSWKKLIKFVVQEKVDTFHKDIWRELLTDPTLLYSKWERDKSTIHIFTAKNPKVMRVLVLGMLTLPSEELWKALALKTLIEEYEKDLKEIFADPAFVSSYGKLLRKVYFHFMPWYFKMLFVLPLKVLEDYFFKAAKRMITEEQKMLAEKNRLHYKILTQKKEQEKKENLDNLTENVISNTILEKLETIYFIDKNIPLVSDVKEFFPDIDTNGFLKIIKNKNFRVISFKEGDSEPMSGILLFPVNHEWQDKKNKLKTLLARLIDDLDTDFIAEAEKTLLSKARRLKHVIEKNTYNETGSTRKKQEEEEDPYKRLEKELKHYSEPTSEPTKNPENQS
ncbi:MAG: hypothetical protein KDK90_04585 [Leptospiraceae bacterium]|nr:hypothetical protein [Leptospiraceae bacterium]